MNTLKFFLTVLIVSGFWMAVDEVVFNGNSVEYVDVIGTNVEYEGLVPLVELKRNQGYEQDDEFNNIVIIGTSALSSSNCTALGASALSHLMSGSDDNVVIGYSAGNGGILTNVRLEEKKDFWKEYEENRK